MPFANKIFSAIADTLVAPPIIYYPPVEKVKTLTPTKDQYNYLYSSAQKDRGAFQFNIPANTLIQYLVMEPEETGNSRIVLPVNFYQTNIKNICPGKYSVFFVTNKFYTAVVEHISIKAGGTEVLRVDSLTFTKENSFINELLKKQGDRLYVEPPAKTITPKIVTNDIPIEIPAGTATIKGTVKDMKGKNPVVGASVILKKYRKGTATDINGNFIISNIKAGRYILQVASVGYETKLIEVVTKEDDIENINIELKISKQSMDEVVVIGYGSVKKKDLTGAISTISANSITDVSTLLQGRLAGVSVVSDSDAGVGNAIRVRGASSLAASNNPLYVIDGIVYTEMPANLASMKIVTMDILKDATATALYGARGAYGVIVITTDAKTFRKDFKDYALWQPNFFTDKKGHAAVEINYPDNITGWKTFIVAMDKKRRMGRASVLTQAYKPVAVELSVPQFLLEGDVATVIAKNKNYTNGKYTVASTFTVNNKTVAEQQTELMPNDAAINKYEITAINTDTITTRFTLQTTTGFKDGEERKIPVFKKGTEESIGNFWVLRNDTTVSYTASQNNSGITLYAQNNTFDLMLDELDHLRQYPYYCMEQTASKLTGLILEEKIKKQLHQPFKYQVELSRLLQKLQKAQQFDGSWSWWENGKPDFYISNYIANALLRVRENPLVETNIRNAFLYLHNQLGSLKKNELLAALVTLSNGKHEMDYSQWLHKINFDSLSQHQQWQWVQIKQQQKMNYQTELKQLVDKKINTMLGGTHWGVENYLWYSNEVASTVLAFNVLKNEPAYKEYCDAIIQYFLEKRKEGYWRNTVESATILDAILPTVLEQQANFVSPATITVSGDTNFVISNFSNKINIKNDAIKNLQIKKSGGGMVYFTAYQKTFNPAPTAVTDKFVVSTYFEKNNAAVSQIIAGEKVTMIVKVDVLKDADYVMMEVPIPGGCTYASKDKTNWKVYKEFFKNKVMLFSEHLSKGVHQFEIELEPRYTGTYTLNPARVELMYFPVFYGRNDLKKVSIQ